jgi:hypothetical protein
MKSTVLADQRVGGPALPTRQSIAVSALAFANQRKQLTE